MENVFGYSAPIWQRFSQPRRAGALPEAPGVISAQAGSPAAKSVLRLWLRIEGGQVTDARFQAYGCPTAIAVGEWLAERAIGQPRVALERISAQDIRAALEIGEDKAHCALMGEDALKSVLSLKRHEHPTD